MRKFGFTLAEVLLTLSIIGVVAALAAPSLVQNVGDSRIGPSLAKARNTFQEASQLVIADRRVTRLSDIGNAGNVRQQDPDNPQQQQEAFDGADSVTRLINAITANMRITDADFMAEPEGNEVRNYNPDIQNDNQQINLGRYRRLDSDDGMIYMVHIGAPEPNPPAPNRTELGRVYVDINGERGQNRESNDIFGFVLFDDGTLRPMGGKGMDPEWRGHCDDTVVRGVDGFDPTTCTGSIFENDLRVIYDR